MNHKIVISYFVVLGFLICLVFAYIKYSSSVLETENDKLRQNIVSAFEKQIEDLKTQIDELKKGSIVSSGATDEQAFMDFVKKNPAFISETIENFYRSKNETAMHNLVNESTEGIMKDFNSGLIRTMIGDEKAPIKIVQFLDYSCSFCAKMADINDKILAENKDVSIIFMEIPMLGAESLEATRFATSVAMFDRSKYKDFQYNLFMLDGPKNPDSLFEAASKSGIDVKKLQNFMSDRFNMDIVEERIKQNSIVFNNTHVQSIPLYFIGDEMLVGAVTFDEINEKISDVRKRMN